MNLTNKEVNELNSTFIQSEYQGDYTAKCALPVIFDYKHPFDHNLFQHFLLGGLLTSIGLNVRIDNELSPCSFLGVGSSGIGKSPILGFLERFFRRLECSINPETNCFISVPTAQALSEHLRQENVPKSLITVLHEFSIFINSLTEYTGHSKSTALPRFMEVLFDNQDSGTVTRNFKKLGLSTDVIYNIQWCFLSGVQPISPAIRFMSNDNTGFKERFLFAEALDHTLQIRDYFYFDEILVEYTGKLSNNYKNRYFDPMFYPNGIERPKSSWNYNLPPQIREIISLFGCDEIGNKYLSKLRRYAKFIYYALVNYFGEDKSHVDLFSKILFYYNSTYKRLFLTESKLLTDDKLLLVYKYLSNNSHTHESIDGFIRFSDICKRTGLGRSYYADCKRIKDIFECKEIALDGCVRKYNYIKLKQDI